MMTTTEHRKHWSLRKWLVPASLAAAMVILPGAASTAEAHGRQHDTRMRHTHRYDHYQSRRVDRHHGRSVYRHGGRSFRPVHVNYYRPRAYRPVSFYLETPYVIAHGPRINARVVYYPGNVALYEPGYCPSEVHYHPYERDHRVDVRARFNVHIGF